MLGPTDYDSIARRYAANIDEQPWNALYERPTTLDLLPDVNGKDVLDAGCAHGWYADWLARKGARVVAVDDQRIAAASSGLPQHDHPLRDSRRHAAGANQHARAHSPRL